MRGVLERAVDFQGQTEGQREGLVDRDGYLPFTGEVWGQRVDFWSPFYFLAIFADFGPFF